MSFRLLCLTGAACLTLAGAAVAVPGTLGPNLLQNGSFDHPPPSSGGAPPGWTWGTANQCQATMALDTTVAHAGKPSLRLHSDTAYAPNVYGGLAARVTGLRPRGEYVIRLWAKGKGVGTCWFGGGPQWLARRGVSEGDYDWRQLELRWTAPVGVTDFELRINVDSQTEALWVADVTFQEVNPISLVPRVTPIPLAERSG